MGGFLSRQRDRPRIQHTIDKVFYDLAETDHSKTSGEQTINFAELYIGVLLVYNDINKAAKQVHSEPPSRKEVEKMLEKFDTNKDGVLDRKEFEEFVMQFTKGATKQVAANLALVCVLVPTLVFVTKEATKPFERVGPVVQKVPGAIFATLYLFLLSQAGMGIK